jgi:hypothetical protein
VSFCYLSHSLMLLDHDYCYGDFDIIFHRAYLCSFLPLSEMHRRNKPLFLIRG